VAEVQVITRKGTIAGITALLMATSVDAVHADWDTRFPLPSVQLPQEMLGEWCLGLGKEETSDGSTLYFRKEGEEECIHGQQLTVRPDGWDEVWDNCPFTKITKEANGVYLIYSRCEMLAEGDGRGLGSYFIVNQEYEIDEDGGLVVRQVPEL
jgi:hypothetical protein